MKAAFITQTGPPDVIQYGELPDPKPVATQVLVKVGAVAVNPIDTYIRGGLVAMPLKFPYVVGCDLAGTVVECGPDIRSLKVGDRVWGSNQGLLGRQGTFAELVALDERWLYPTPTGQSDAEAAAGAPWASQRTSVCFRTPDSNRGKRFSSTAERGASAQPSCS